MSLHIESTEEVLAELKRQRAKSLAAAISVSFLGVALMGLLLYLVNIITAIPEEPAVTVYPMEERRGEDPIKPEITRPQRPSSPHQKSEVRIVVSTATTDVPINNPEIDVEIPSDTFSEGLEFGDNIGFNNGKGPGGYEPDDITLSKRCDLNDRMKRITENGGTPQCEEAVVKSLRWLKKQQNGNGSWGDGQFKASMTGITLLAYLAHCETPLSEEFGENVLKGISFLVDLGMKNPVISEQPGLKEVCYDHAVATYALCEAYTFCKQMDIPSISNLERVVVKAVDRILDAQCPNGGWAYSYNNRINPNIDLSVTGWNVQALKAAEHGGIKPTKGEIRTALRKAAMYCRKNVMPDGKFSYKENGENPRSSLVGVGVLSLQMTGNGSDSAARKGLDWIKNNVKTLEWGKGSGTENVKSNLYMHYYCVQAAMNRGGDVWASYNKAFRDAVLGGQKPDGSFSNNDTGYAECLSGKSKNIYRQCLATLMLETYYRFLPGTGEGTKNS
ncbi:prenyltransferase/squalene oxidase repeat-containing protein [Akkermansia sp.]|uniref:prenyltransferase/squalene oxidase repeat-containing protein n=4 Tax=unclassified Akkermansia TaxID=2608915 RepID=UPI0039950AA8